MSSSRRYTPALLLLFVGSGCAALIYEVVWFQLLQLVIGSSAISLGVLLGTFMGGMCLGSLLLPRYVGPGQHPLRVYAYLELGIAVIGILVLFGMPLVSGIYTAWAGSGSAGIFLRAIAAAICRKPCGPCSTAPRSTCSKSSGGARGWCRCSGSSASPVKPPPVGRHRKSTTTISASRPGPPRGYSAPPSPGNIATASPAGSDGALR